MTHWTPEEIAAVTRYGPPDPALAPFHYPADPHSNFDPERSCPHTPAQTYTREPCSCGRALWPPRGRGRGESLTSPRRMEAFLRSFDAMALHVKGYPYRIIAQQLGYK